MDMQNYRFCTGAIVYNTITEQVLLVRNRKDTKWTIPKGGQEMGLTELENAAKEVYEETGVEVNPVGWEVGTYLKVKKDFVNRVKVFVMTPKYDAAVWGDTSRGPEGRLARWMCLYEAISHLESQRTSTPEETMLRSLQSHLHAAEQHEFDKKQEQLNATKES